MLTAELLLKKPIADRAAGETILKALSTLVPEIEPQRYGNWEPLKRVFDPNRLEEALQLWEFDFLWKRSNPRFTGHVFMAVGPKVRYPLIILRGPGTAIAPIKLLALVRHLAVLYEAEFAYVHQLFNQVDVERSLANRSAHNYRSGYFFGVSEGLLSSYLPDLYWVTILGPSYVNLFGRDRLRAAPAPHLEALPYGGVLLRLGDDLEGLQSQAHFERFDAIRCAIKEHLNSNAFFDPRLAPDHHYEVPDAFRDPNQQAETSPLTGRVM